MEHILRRYVYRHLKVSILFYYLSIISNYFSISISIFFQIEVKVIKMCRPIMAVLNIIILDMVAKSKWFLKHMICFKPEELELDVICDSHKQELHFQYIPENSTKVLPIVFHNRNNTDVPVKLSILQVRFCY